MSECPFKVGDRIQQADFLTVYDSATGAVLASSNSSLNPRTNATVTKITELGFEYQFDEPIYFGRPHFGTTSGGICYPAGYNLWIKVGKAPNEGLYWEDDYIAI